MSRIVTIFGLMEELSNHKALAHLKTNSFVTNPIQAIFLAMAVGMTLMFVSIALNGSIYVSMGALFLGIMVVYGYSAGKIKYTLVDEGIHQEIKLFIPYFLFKKTSYRKIEWKDIRSFKHDTDMKRGMRTYEYLKLYLNKAPSEIWITNEHNKEDFDVFVAVFKRAIQNSVPSQSVTQEKKHITQKKSFYSSRFAYALSIFFAILCLALLYYGYQYGFNKRNWFRMAAIIVPGTIYMFIRVFLSKSKNK